MSPKDVPLPERLKDMPQWHGYVITYVTFVGEDGMPDFKVVDEKKRKACLNRGLCGICGQKLDENLIVFIGGPLCVKNRAFLDPPMHKECAVYSAMVCPYLSNSYADYSKAAPKHLGQDQSVFTTFEHVNPHRPDRLAVYYCRAYEVFKNGATWCAKAGKPFRVDWDLMPKKGEEDA